MNLPPDKDPASIGNILIDMKLLSEFQLSELVDMFKASKDELLGEFIVRRTKITVDQIEIALLRQKRMRGKTNEAMVIRLLEISKDSHQNVVAIADQLTMATKMALK